MRFRGLAFGTTVAALILALGSNTAVAQEENFYGLSYFSNANVMGAPDAALRLVNDGALSDASPEGDFCASLYVFDSAEQLNECCSCKITPNGILSLSVNTNLTSNTLTGIIPTRGVVKVVSGFPIAGLCDPTLALPFIGISLRGWLTHVQKATTGYSLTEEDLMDSNLGQLEATDLAEDCGVLIELGTGHGRCSCIDSLQ